MVVARQTDITPSDFIHQAQNWEMQSYVIFTCALTLLLTSLHVLAQESKQVIDDSVDPCTLVQQQMSTSLREVTNKNLVLTSDNKNLTDQLSRVTRENENLKLQLQESQSFKNAVLNGLADIKSIMNTQGALKLENETFIITSETKITENFAHVLSGQSQLSADIQAVNKSVNEEITRQTQNKEMLTQVLSKLEQHDEELKSHRNHSQELHMDLPTTTLGKRYYFSFDQPRMTWYEADNFCRTHGMQLLSVETQHGWDLIKPQVEKLNNEVGYWPWSGGTDVAVEGKWKWIATGNDVKFFGRQAMENRVTENCMVLHRGYWDDLPCTFNTSFICEVNWSC